MTRHAPARRTDAGFTMIELLIAVVITGLLAGVILQFVGSQAKFTDVQYARQEVQDNARGTLELIASELRGVPVPGGIEMAGEDTIRFRSPLAWGINCGGATTSTSRWVVFDKGVWVSSVSGVPGTVGLALQSQEDPTPLYDFASGVTRSDSLRLDSPDAAPCAGLATTADAIAVRFNNVPTTGVSNTRGMVAYVWRSVAYGDGSNSAAGERFVNREFGSSTEPIAGPVEEFQLRYLNAAGTAITPFTAADRDQIRAVRVIVSMKGRANDRRTTGVFTKDSITISLRNTR